MKKILFTTIAFLSIAVFAEKKVSLDDTVKNKLKELNALKYVHKESSFYNDYEDIYLGYDKEGNINSGIIIQIIKKTYKKIKTVTIIKKEKETYKITDILIPNISIITDKKKKEKVQKTIDSFKGVIILKDKKINKVDAVSGATYCHKRVYSDLNEIAETLIEFMKEKNDSEKKNL